MGSRLYIMEERLEGLERVRRIAKVPIFKLKDRSNPVEDLDEVQFLRRFHMRKSTVMFTFNLIKNELKRPHRRGCPVPVLLEVCIAIRFFATDATQIVVGDLYNVDQSTVSRIVVRVATAIAKLAMQFVKYPSFAEAPRVKAQFFAIGGFPGVVGCIDCTHAMIQCPGGPNAELFRNRKGTYSLNIQAICDANLVFTDVVVRWYGSAHDSRIFDNSLIKDKLENNEVPGILLGDGGYACTQFMMTPILNPRTPSEKRYNCAQIKTRNTIERTFGVWKRRFPCLRMLRIRIGNAITVATALAALHNICRKRCDLFGEDIDDDLDLFNQQNLGQETAPPTMSGRAARAQIVAAHF